MARLDYLFGIDGNPPTRQTRELATRHKLPTLAIRRHAGSWLAEVEAYAQSQSRFYGKAVDPVTVSAHEEDVAFLRRQVDKLKKQVNDTDPQMVGLETYEFRIRQLLKLQKRWSELAGVEDALKVSATAQKEVARLTLRAAAADSSSAPADNARRVDARIFEMDQYEDIPEE